MAKNNREILKLMNKKLLVIIVTYNSGSVIGDCLKSLDIQTEKSFSIFIVDNASSDDSITRIKNIQFRSNDLNTRLELVQSDVNLGFSKAVNKGIKYAINFKYDAVLLLNPDTKIDKNLFKDAINTFAKNPDIGAASSIILYPNGRIWSQGAHIYTTRELLLGLKFGVATNLKKGEKFKKNTRKLIKVEALVGCALFIRTEAVKRTGFLNESFFMYAEDSEYSRRLSDAGFNLVCFTSSSVMHDAGDESINFTKIKTKRKKYFIYLSSQIKYLWQKNPLVCMIWILELPIILIKEYVNRTVLTNEV
jgi:GT2 family glycosyltransferase